MAQVAVEGGYNVYAVFDTRWVKAAKAKSWGCLFWAAFSYQCKWDCGKYTQTATRYADR